MKVAFVLGTTSGGTGAHVRMLASGCAAAGAAVSVYGPATTDRDFGFSLDGISFAPVEFADRPRAARDVRALARLRGLIRSAAPDIVHAHGLRAGALAVLALAVLAGPRRPPLVLTVHNAPPAGGTASAVYRMLEHLVARRADSVLCVSADLEQRMRAAGARRVAAAIVPAPAVPAPAVTGAAPAVAAQTSDGRPLVLAVGRLAPQKGFGVLLEAAARWRDLDPEPRLMIVGQGPLDAELKAKAASLAVPAEFAGQRADVPALLAAADVFALPSRWEGQALVLQEALRAGVPIVATRVGGNPALTGADAAVLVPPDDPDRFAGAVRAVLTDPALAGRLREAAADRASTLPGERAAVMAVLAEYRALAR